ncbi:MAG: carboxypeptidase-like regulatory domain-containing protein [Candidatus Bathyarchaeota archaeon]|nr:carboxypeptidase-like regulatory domain-containing protein [Candidatus Bathyarchaeota archaeon]
MKRFAIIVLLSCLLIPLTFLHSGNVPEAKASPIMHQGDLILTGNNVTVMEGQFDINGSIIVEDNATLVVRNVILNFTQARNNQFNMTFRNPANGNPRLLGENMTLLTAYRFDINFYGNSSCKADKLEVWPTVGGYGWYMYDSSIVSISDSKVYSVTAREDSIFEAFNCTMRYMTPTQQVSANISLSDIEALRCHDSSAVNVSNSEIWWQFQARHTAVVTASNSIINEFETYESSVVRLVNSTCTSYSISNESKAYISWYLDVHVTDSIGQDVPAANVTATYQNGTLAESELTDAAGLARLPLTEKMMNVTGDYAFGSYTVNATCLSYSSDIGLTIIGNQAITLKLEGFVIPEFPNFLTLLLFMMTTSLIFTVYRRKVPFRI